MDYLLSSTALASAAGAHDFLPTDDGLPCPITELHALHPAVLANQATINIGITYH